MPCMARTRSSPYQMFQSQLFSKDCIAVYAKSWAFRQGHYKCFPKVVFLIIGNVILILIKRLCILPIQAIHIS